MVQSKTNSNEKSNLKASKKYGFFQNTRHVGPKKLFSAHEKENFAFA